MKKIIRFSITISLLTVILGMISGGLVVAQDSTETVVNSGISFMVTIDGLEKGDQAKLSLSPESDSSPNSIIVTKTILGAGDRKTVAISAALNDGNYQLILETTEKYFRNPRGYFFQIRDSEIVNPSGHPFTFELIPPSSRNYQPYRGDVTVSGTSTEVIEPKPTTVNEIPYRMEYITSLSIPPKQSHSEKEGILSAYYHYMGPVTRSNNYGVWGALGVVNTGVRHNIYPYEEFTADRVYAYWFDANNNEHWMEVGWVEHSSQLDYRYLYEYNSTSRTWRILFQVSTGTTINVAVMHDSGTYWMAQYWNGSYWVQVGYEDIGFSQAAYANNGGEVYTYDGTHPAFPAAYTTTSKLYVSGAWDTWDRDYSTYIYDWSPYNTHMLTNYYYFYIHKD